MRVWGQEDRIRSDSAGTRGQKDNYRRDKRTGWEVRVWGQQHKKISECVRTGGQEDK